ncbi:anaerobic ribonucleoside-triphosphate reductase activating protein [Parcubacteria bacterium DG_74_3]|nr:MAG: anaerobic ribonucleoside-triphosphate reductase activating protein [Parcubacteria bacterium DG_74_3]
MEIGGLQKLTLIDYPRKIACTVFLTGCNFLCPWCYAREFVLPEEIKKQPKISEKEFFQFLKERKGLLEGVVLCGGEPTIHHKLPTFIKKIKKMNYLVKLDTNGSNPKMMGKLISEKLIDYVAMDVKLPKERYSQVFSKNAKIKDIEESIKILKKGKVDYEFRTTIVPTIHKKEDIIKIVRWIKPAKRYFLQNFRPEKTIDPFFETIKPYPESYLLEIQKIIAPFFEACQVR